MTLARGPCREVSETRAEVWVPDINAGHPTWPVFANEALRYGVRGVSPFPLAFGASWWSTARTRAR